VIKESAEANVGTYATSPSVVNGYLAQPVDAGSISATGTSAINLQAKEFDDPFPGSPGPVEFKIVTPPSAGSLDRPTGEWFSGSLVHYTPAPGQSGPVAFTFAARDSMSAFPRNPPAASAAVSVAGLPGPGPGPPPATLAISGAPESVQTSSVTRLAATGPEASSGVSWSADGNVGGSRQLGTLSLDGVYTAPASAPPGGVVRIGARTVSGAGATVPIRIVQAPPAKAAPSSALVPAAHGRLSQLVRARQRRTLIAIVVPGRRGRLSFVARRGGQRIASCSMAAEARARSTCSMKLSRKIAPDPFICKVPKTKGLKLPGVTVTATLYYGGRPRVTRWAKTR
jgi:hypothetical protein